MKRIAKLNKTEILQKAATASSRSEYRELSVQQLRTAVREAVKDVNIRAQYRESEQSQVALNKLKIAGLEVADRPNLEKAQKQISKRKVSANVNWKSKEELITQLQALKKYQKADTESEIAKEEYEKGFEDAYGQFLKSDKGADYSNVTLDQFKQIINKLDTFESAISKKEFKYEIFEAVKTANEQGISFDMDDLFSAFENGGTEEDVINGMYEAIGLTR